MNVVTKESVSGARSEQVAWVKEQSRNQKLVGVAVESDVCRVYGQKKKRRESVGDQAVPSR